MIIFVIYIYTVYIYYKNDLGELFRLLQIYTYDQTMEIFG